MMMADIYSLYEPADYLRLMYLRGHLPKHLVLVLPVNIDESEEDSVDDDSYCCACFEHDSNKHCGEQVGRDCYGIFICPMAYFPE